MIDLGLLEIGMSRAAVYAALGTPDDVAYCNRKQRRTKKPAILLYGKIELHFHEDKLWLVYTENDDHTEGYTLLK